MSWKSEPSIRFYYYRFIDEVCDPFSLQQRVAINLGRITDSTRFETKIQDFWTKSVEKLISCKFWLVAIELSLDSR